MKWPSHNVNTIQNKKVIPVWNSRRCEFSHVNTLRWQTENTSYATLCVGVLERKRILLRKSNLFETSLHLAYFHHKYCLSYRWGKLLRRNIVIFMAVEAHLLPRKELGPAIIISPRARQGRGRTISTRAVSLLLCFSCACLGAWSYFITSIFIYRACLNCILYLYILQQICTYFITELPSLWLRIIPGICCRHFLKHNQM